MVNGYKIAIYHLLLTTYKMEIEQLKYPIGKFTIPDNPTDAIRSQWLNNLATLPGRLETTVATLNDAQMDTPYRPDGWTVRQVVHHLADSHMNAFCRIKFTLTEESPTIKPYHEADWAAMDDYKMLPVIHSIALLRGLHVRMVFILKNMTAADRKKFYVHPEYGKTYTLETVMTLYAWHSNHHLAHITSLKKRMDWA